MPDCRDGTRSTRNCSAESKGPLCHGDEWRAQGAFVHAIARLASREPNPWIGAFTPRLFKNHQIILLNQVTTGLPRSCSSRSMLWTVPHPPQGM